tara:strand:+ start:8533 stop:8961 length:429 start_codon:yes stop_codon:yes gene_type:complete
MINTKYVKCAGAIIINKNNEVAVVNQNHDSWSLPKGHIDPGETKIDAAKRELYEETGIKNATLIKYIGEYGRYRIGLDGKDDKSEHKTIFIYLFKSNQKILKPIDPHNPEAKWVPYQKVEKILTHPNDREFYKQQIKLIINI